MLNELANSSDSGIIQLRRDNDYNYNLIADIFIPANGEICLVDTARDGLRAKCGDGKTPWKELEYIDEYVVKGYFKDGNFYKDSAFTKLIQGATQKVYIDIGKRNLYFFHNGVFYTTAGQAYNLASETEEGVMKLYQSTGAHTDGTMTQKAISDELDDKVEITLNASEEMLIFTT